MRKELIVHRRFEIKLNPNPNQRFSLALCLALFSNIFIYLYRARLGEHLAQAAHSALARSHRPSLFVLLVVVVVGMAFQFMRRRRDEMNLCQCLMASPRVHDEETRQTIGDFLCPKSIRIASSQVDDPIEWTCFIIIIVIIVLLLHCVIVVYCVYTLSSGLVCVCVWPDRSFNYHLLMGFLRLLCSYRLWLCPKLACDADRLSYRPSI